MRYSQLSIIIPTLNEERNIGRLIDKLIENYHGCKLIIIDDGSKDATREIIKKKIKGEKHVFIDRSKEKIKGLTISVLEGILKNDLKYFVVMDADFQHPINALDKLLNKLKNAKIVIGSRKNKFYHPNIFRTLTSISATELAKIRLITKGTYIKDPLSGFFGGETEFIRKIIKQNKKRFVLPGFKVLFDILKAAPPRSKIEEVDFILKRRERGASKVNFNIGLSYLKSLFK